MDSDHFRPGELETADLDGESEDGSRLLAEEPEDEARIVFQRAQWFGNRAGSLTDSTSSFRYLTAVKRATETPVDPRETIIKESDIDRLSDAFTRFDREALLFDAHMELDALEQKAFEWGSFLGGFGRVLRVESVPAPYALLAMVVTPEDAVELDLDTAAFAHWAQNGSEETIQEATKYFAANRLLIGRITEPGFYQAIALPSHPFSESILKQLASIWSQWRFYYLTTGLETASRFSESVQEAISSLPDSPEGKKLASFFEPVIEWFSRAEHRGIDVMPEPPLIKLWRLLRLRTDEWSALGPVATDDAGTIGRVTQLDTHPQNGDIIIAAAAGGGVWRSDCAGRSWRPLMETQATLTMGAVAFAPSNPDVIYAASGEDAGPWNPSWPGAGVYRGENGGANWSLTAKTTSARFSAIMVDRNDPYIVYVAGNRGLHKSIDGGRSWLNNPGLLSLFDGPVTDLVLDYDCANTVYIGVQNLGILRSFTGGQSVNGAQAFTLFEDPPLPTGCDAGWVKLAIGRRGKYQSKFIVAKVGHQGESIFTTIDGGDTWTKKADVAPTDIVEWTSVIAVHPSDDNLLYAGSAVDKLNFSENQGESWFEREFGPRDQQDIAFDNQNDNRIYVANDSGVYQSSDKGENWYPASKGMIISQVYDLDISEQDARIVACGTQDTGMFYLGNSSVWESFGASDVTQVAIDPTDSRIVYSLGPTAGETIILNRLSAVGGRVSTIRLRERGPWVPILKLHPHSNIENPATDRKMFLCGGSTFYHSSDAGQCFQRVDYKLAGPLITDGEISALEYAPGDPSILYLGTSKGVLYKARNGGLIAEDWTRIEEDFPHSPIASIAIDWRNSDYVWVVLAGNGVSRLRRPEQNDHSCVIHVVRTSDGGSTWVNASGRIADMRLPDVPMSAIALDPFDKNVAYVGTDVGVFRTSDGGVSWLAFQKGLPRSPVTELRLNRRERILFAATMGRGVHRRRLD